MKKILIHVSMISFLVVGIVFAQDSGVARKIIQLAGDMETYAQLYEKGEAGGVKFSDSQLQQFAQKYDNAAQEIAQLLSGEPVIEDEIPAVYELIDYLIGDADRRFYSRVRSNYIGRLQVAKDTGSVEEIDFLLANSSKFYSTPKGNLLNPREDTIEKLEEIKSLL